MWRCFLAGDTDLEARYLTVTEGTPETGCSPYGYHHARAWIEDGPYTSGGPADVPGRHWHAEPDPGDYRSHPAWPTRCDGCQYPFTTTASRRVWTDPLFRTADGKLWAQGRLPIGAIIRAWWQEAPPRWVGPDGQSLQVKLPPGGPHDWWAIDGPAGNAPAGEHGWQRTGTPPDLSVTPSIRSPEYHGFLGSNGTPAGWLSDPLADS